MKILTWAIFHHNSIFLHNKFFMFQVQSPCHHRREWHTINQSIDPSNSRLQVIQSTNQSIDSTNQAINQSIARSNSRFQVIQSTNQSIDSTNQTINQSTYQSCDISSIPNQSINRPTTISKSVFSLNCRGLEVLTVFCIDLGDENFLNKKFKFWPERKEKSSQPPARSGFGEDSAEKVKKWEAVRDGECLILVPRYQLEFFFFEIFFLSWKKIFKRMIRQGEAAVRFAQVEFDRQMEITRIVLDKTDRSKMDHLRALVNFVDLQLAHERETTSILQKHKGLIEKYWKHNTM